MPNDPGIEMLTLLFSDIEGSTTLVRRLGDLPYAEVLEEHRRVVRRAIAEHGGHEEGTEGDSFLVSFPSARNCVAAAVQIQRDLVAHEWLDGVQVRVRIGIHTGEVGSVHEDRVGYELHHASRIASACHGGQVVLSASTTELVRDWLPDGVDVRDLGSHRLKDLTRPERLFQLVGPGLPDGFPPLRALQGPGPAGNLHRGPSPLVGRVAELAEVGALVVAESLVTVVGPGGSGKSRLAIEVGSQHNETFADGVWLVELAPLSDGEQLTSLVGRTLGVRADGLDARDGLAAALERHQALVILDNCEHLITEAALLVDVLARRCPDLRVLATSREPLGIDGERVYRLGPMSLPPPGAEGADELAGSDAVELFCRRASALDATFSVSDEEAVCVASICRRLDGIPLALELAAARTTSLSLGDLDARLDHRFHLLTSGSRSALPRQQTLAATIAWSYELLTEAERRVLGRLSVFVGSFDLGAAEDVCAADEEGAAAGTTGSVDPALEVADLLGSLVTKSLVNVTSDRGVKRYVLLESIREYAAERLREAGGQEEAARLRGRHAEHYLAQAEVVAPLLHGPEQATWLRQLDAEWSNLLAAFEWFAAQADGASSVQRLAVAIARHLATRLHRQPVAMLRASLEGDDVAGRLRVRALIILATLDDIMPNRDETILDLQRLYQRATDLARELGDEQLIAESLVWLSGTYRLLDRREDALSLAEESRSLARRVGDARILGFATNAVADAQPTPADARPLRLEALALFEEAGDLAWMCGVYDMLTLADFESGAPLDEVRSLIEAAVVVAEELESTLHQALFGSILGIVCFVQGDVDAAESNCRRTLRLMRQMGWLWRARRAVLTLACCTAARGDATWAAQLLGASETMSRQPTEHGAVRLTPHELAASEATVVALVDTLGAEGFERERSRGRLLALDQITRVALAHARDAGTT